MSRAALGSNTRCRHLSSCLPYNREEFPGIFNNNFRLVCLQSLGLHQFAADAQRNSAGFDEFSRSIQVDAARRNKKNLRKRAFQRLDVFRAPHLAAGENLDKIRAGFPSGYDLRGCQCPGHHQLPFPYCTLDGLKVEPRTDQKLCTGIETAARRFSVEDSSRSNEDVRSSALGEFADDVDSAGHGHGDFDDRNAALTHSFSSNSSFMRGRRADDWYDPYFCDSIANLLFIHFQSLLLRRFFNARCAPRHLSSLA